MSNVSSGRRWWRRTLILLLAPVWLVMIFTGFPPPLPPWLRTKAAQEQTQPYRREARRPGQRLDQ